MAYDGNGTFNRLYNWQADAANGIDIMAERMDNEMNGMATALSTAFLRDGQAAMQANADMGNNKLLRVADPTLDTDGVNKKWIDDNFLSSQGDTTIEGEEPGIGFEENDQIADLNKWKIKVKDTSFVIEPLQSDASSNDDFGEFRIDRDIDGTNLFNAEGGNFHVNVGDYRTDQTSWIGVTGYEFFDTKFIMKRQTQIDDGVFVDILNYRDKDALPLNGNLTAPGHILQFGDGTFNNVEYIVNSSGRHDFYCGDGNTDMTIESSGLYSWSPIYSDADVRAHANFDRDTLAVTGGIAMGHGGSNAYINNYDSGDLQFRFGDNTMRAEIRSDGQIHTTAGMDIEGLSTFKENVVIDKTANDASAFFTILPKSDQAAGIRIQDSGGTNRQIAGRTAAGEFFVGSSGVVTSFRGSGDILFAPAGQTTEANARAKILSNGGLAGGVHNAWGGFTIQTGASENMNFDNNGSGAYRFESGTALELTKAGNATFGGFVACNGGDQSFTTNSGNNRWNNNAGTGGFQMRRDGTNVFTIAANNGYMTVPGVYANSNSGTTNLVRVSSTGQFQRSTSLARTKKQMRNLQTHVKDEDPTPSQDAASIIEALNPIVYESEFDADAPGQLYAGFTVEDMQTNYPVAVPTGDPTDYDIKAVMALAIAGLQEAQTRLDALEKKQPRRT